MKNLIVCALGILLLTACGGENAPADKLAVVSDSDLSGNHGQVLSTIQVPGYTYIEVRNNGRSVWLAGNPIEVADGEIISWSKSTVMRNFKSTALDRTFEEVVFVSGISLGVDAAMPVVSEASVPKDVSSGIVQSTENAGGYTYIELETDAGDVVWLAAPETELADGQHIEWQGASKMANFNSPSLDKTFPEILFVSGVQ